MHVLVRASGGSVQILRFLTQQTRSLDVSATDPPVKLHHEINRVMVNISLKIHAVV